MHSTNFALLSVGSSISALGDALFDIALAFTVYQLTHSTILLSVVMIADVVPVVILGFFAGVIVDLSSKKHVMILMDAARGACLMILGALFFFQFYSIPLVVLCCVLIAACDTFYMPATDCAIPSMVGDRVMTRATSALISVQEISKLIGQSLGGFLLVSIGAPILFVLDGCSFFLSGLCAAFLHFTDLKSSHKTQSINFSFLIEQFKISHNYLLSNGAYKNLVCSTVVAVFFSSVSGAVVVPLFSRDYSPQIYGVAIGLLSLGTIVGSALITFIPIEKYKFRLFFVGMVFCNSGYFICAFHVNHLVLYTMFFISGAFCAVYNTIMETVLILSVPISLRGKISSSVFSAVKALTPFGILLGGFLGQFVPLQYIIILSLSLNVLSYLVFFFSPKNKVLFHTEQPFESGIS